MLQEDSSFIIGLHLEEHPKRASSNASTFSPNVSQLHKKTGDENLLRGCMVWADLYVKFFLSEYHPKSVCE